MEAIFHEFHARLVFFAYEITGNEEQAHDIVLGKFMELWQDREKLTFNSEKSLKSYLYTGTKLRSIDQLRRVKAEQKVLKGYKNITVEIEDPFEKEALILKTEAIAKLATAIETLPAQYKATVEMAIAGKSNAEIASTLGIKESSVRSNMARARILLLKKFTGDLGVTLFIMTLGTTAIHG
ncbi:sigma-70 family RNA polymerase sigma factor [Dinghuibacter silviterrae]|nr:sigma-70 family RNA polymerase sigma factor [Dinghuibacter silviterrae]